MLEFLLSGLLFAFFMTGCQSYAICTCAQELNVTLTLKDGETGACIPGAVIHLFRGSGPDEAAYTPTFMVDTAGCRYAIASGAGPLKIRIGREGYGEIMLQKDHIEYHDDECCGDYDDKRYEITWYRSALNKDPVIK